jgi:hypothetical protein
MKISRPAAPCRGIAKGSSMSVAQQRSDPALKWHHKRWPFQEGRFHFSVALFLAALVLMLTSLPFAEGLSYGNVVASILMTVVLLSAVLAVGGHRRSLLWGIVLVTPAIFFQWLRHLQPDVSRVFVVVPGMVFVGYVIVHLFVFIFRARRVNSEVLCAGVANYLLMGLLWSFAYVLIGDIAPDAFAFTAGPDSIRRMEGFNCIYFSFVTLSTIGYGDVIPVAPAARMLAITEATSGLFYIAILISRLVSLQATTAAPSHDER